MLNVTFSIIEDHTHINQTLIFIQEVQVLASNYLAGTLLTVIIEINFKLALA